jgi:hypothetical protein
MAVVKEWMHCFAIALSDIPAYRTPEIYAEEG